MNDVSTQIPVAEQFYSVQGFDTPQSLITLNGIEESMPREEYDCFWCDDGTKELWPSQREERERVFCSEECRSEWLSEFNSGEGSPRYDRITIVCEICGEEVDRWPSQVEKYDNHYCSKECAAEGHEGRFAGEDNPVWSGGWENYYGSEWPEMRRKVVERDGDECRRCGTTAEELGKSVDVHHIEPVTSFDDKNDAHTMDNMIQLCPTCHTMAENGTIEVEL